MLLPALVLLSGCGNSRTAVPDLAKPAPPTGFEELVYPRAGVRLEAPRNWLVSAERSPLVMVTSSGPAVIDLWRYRRAAPPPVTATELTAARRALLAAARAQDRSLELVRSAVVTVSGRGAIELDTLQTMDGQRRRVRSMHLYVPGGELVLEEYAPPALFHAVDHLVFSPVRRSLRLTGAGAA